MLRGNTVVDKDFPQEPKEESVGDELFKQGLVSNEETARSLAIKFGMPIHDDLSKVVLSSDFYKKIPYGFVKKHIVLPIKQEDGVVYVAVANPFNIEPIEELRLMLDKEIKAVYSPHETILTAINECYNREEGAASQLISDMGDRSDRTKDSEVEVYDLLDDGLGQAPIVKLLNLILIEAIQQGSSDIHFEPFEDRLRVRYRIDGALQNRHMPAQEYQTQMLARIKVMAKLDIAEHRLPQDGRIKLKMGRREIDFRVSTVPVSGGGSALFCAYWIKETSF